MSSHLFSNFKDDMAYKWLALESNISRVFSIKTDVWSFGIVMWEIFSLGRSPYPNISNPETLIKMLKDGYRMEKPQYATQNM